jgi:hypothetical protein
MRAFACVVLVACGGRETRETASPIPTTSTPAAAIVVVTDASAPVAIADAHVPRPSPYAPVAEILSSPDKIEAFALGTRDFVDGPPRTPHRLTGYPIISALKTPPASFARQFAAIVLQDDAYRREAVHCSLAEKHLGLRFTRGADVVEISILTACPSVSGVSTIDGRNGGGQLEGDRADELAKLLRATFGAAFTR